MHKNTQSTCENLRGKKYFSRKGTKPQSRKDIIYDATKGDFKHPNTMIAKLMAGNDVLLEQEYYSVGGGFIEWKGYTPPKKNAPKYAGGVH